MPDPRDFLPMLPWEGPPLPRWATIDPEIRWVVNELNRMGFVTHASCQGHSDDPEGPSAYVTMSADDEHFDVVMSVAKKHFGGPFTIPTTFFTPASYTESGKIEEFEVQVTKYGRFIDREGIVTIEIKPPETLTRPRTAAHSIAFFIYPIDSSGHITDVVSEQQMKRIREKGFNMLLSWLREEFMRRGV